MDFNNDGEISGEEFMRFWRIVKGSGHTEEEILEELKNIQNGELWTGFDKVKINNTGEKMSKKD